MAECVRCSLQTVTDLGQFTRRKIDALLLCIRTRVLADSFLDKALQLLCHVLDSMGEVGELTRDERYVLILSHAKTLADSRARGVYVGSASPPSTAPGREPRGPGGRGRAGRRGVCAQGSVR